MTNHIGKNMANQTGIVESLWGHEHYGLRVVVYVYSRFHGRGALGAYYKVPQTRMNIILA